MLTDVPESQEHSMCYYYDSNMPCNIDETLSDKEQEISRLKLVAMKSYDENTVRRAIDALALYGKEGIKPINDIIEEPSLSESMKQYGLNAIQRIKIFDPFKP
jgi:hypothetical protein